MERAAAQARADAERAQQTALTGDVNAADKVTAGSGELPAGWKAQLDAASGRYFYIDTTRQPPYITWDDPRTPQVELAPKRPTPPGYVQQPGYPVGYPPQNYRAPSAPNPYMRY